MTRYFSRLALLCAMLLLAFAAAARTYSVDDIPNVQLQDRTRHLVDPDGIVSHETTDVIDSLLLDARRQSSAEVVAVIVEDIDTDDIDSFATRLFNRWGIGKSDKNNGILILVARDGRAATIRTGYGAEGVLPDILSGRIIRDKMTPCFKEGKYELGLLSGVSEVHRLVTDEQARQELMSEEEDNYGAGDEPVALTALKVSGLMSAVMLMIFGLSILGLRGRSGYEKYRGTKTVSQIFTVCTGLMLFLPIFALIVVWLVRRHWRRQPRQCSVCGHKMQLLPQGAQHSAQLTAAQNLEERLKSMKYDVWRCPHCANTAVESYEGSSQYSKCPHCHARTLKSTGYRVLRHPTANYQGEGERDYLCQNCHHALTKSFVIPVRTRSGGFGGGFGGGGGSMGGGFGGGRTGGGGATGRW